MDQTEPANAAALTAELKKRMPIARTPHYDVVFENDLPGRVALAILWRDRQHLTMHLLSDDPSEQHIRALTSGLATVRNAPQIQVVSSQDAERLAAAADRLIWAVHAERTSPETQETLQNRDPKTTAAPFLTPLTALGHAYPNQLDPAHELVLRDVIRHQARFLNFYADRHQPQDLYERSKYPAWLTPQEGFTAAIPTIQAVTTTADGTVVGSNEFTGTLALETADILCGHRASIEFASVCAVLDQRFDVTLEIRNDYVNPAAAGTLEVQLQRNQKTVHTFDVAITATQVQIPLAGLTPRSTLSVAVVALKDNPKVSWSKASQTQVRLTVHPKGTHPVPNVISRAATRLKRVAQRRQRGNQ